MAANDASGAGDMLHSTDRILTTHVGSLPRPEALLGMLDAQDEGRDFDAAALDVAAADAVVDVVRRQIEAGIDIVSDGEMSKMGYTFYVRHRLSGMAPPIRRRPARRRASRPKTSPSSPRSPPRAPPAGSAPRG